MDYKILIVLFISLFSVHATEERKTGNPIIDFFESPLKAFRTRPGEAIAVFEPQILKVNPNTSTSSWFPGQGIGSSITDWLAQRVQLAKASTTTPGPDIIVHVQSVNEDDNKDQDEKNEKNKLQELKSPSDGRQNIEEYDDEVHEDLDGDEETVSNHAQLRQGNPLIYGYGGYGTTYGGSSYGGTPSRKRIRISIRNRNKNRAKGKPASHRRGSSSANHDSYYYDDYDTYYDERPYRHQQSYRPHRRKPNRRRPTYQRPLAQSDFYQPFQDLPPLTRPIRYPGASPLLYGISDSQPIQYLYPSQVNGQIPLLIPIQSVQADEEHKKEKPKPTEYPSQTIHLQIQQATQDDDPKPTKQPSSPSKDPSKDNIGPVTYVPIPLQQLGLQAAAVDSLPLQHIVPQVQVVAQHTHKIQQEPPSTSQLLYGFDDQAAQNSQSNGNQNQYQPQQQVQNQYIQSQQQPQSQQQYSLPTNPYVKTHKPPNRPTFSQTDEDNWFKPTKVSSDGYEFEENFRKADLRKRIINARIKLNQDKPDPRPSNDDFDDNNGGGGYIGVGDNSAEEKSAEGRAQYYIPQKYFPLLNSNSFLEVSTNGRFLLKKARSLDATTITDTEEPKAVVVIPEALLTENAPVVLESVGEQNIDSSFDEKDILEDKVSESDFKENEKEPSKDDTKLDSQTQEQTDSIRNEKPSEEKKPAESILTSMKPGIIQNTPEIPTESLVAPATNSKFRTENLAEKAQAKNTERRQTQQRGRNKYTSPLV